jgi:hypothetical protein
LWARFYSLLLILARMEKQSRVADNENGSRSSRCQNCCLYQVRMISGPCSEIAEIEEDC